jgi:preprotein translocase subunit Sss1
MSNQLATLQEGTEDFIDGLKQFRKDSLQFLNRCTKPDRRGNYPFSFIPVLLVECVCAFVFGNIYACNYAFMRICVVRMLAYECRGRVLAGLAENACWERMLGENARDRNQMTNIAEFIKISQAVAIGFLMMGALGYLVKLVHFPIVSLLVSQ